MAATREGWLLAAVEEYRPYFKQMASVIVPEVLVSVGWGFRTPLKRNGECWASKHSNGVNHIFISPVLADWRVLSVLAHELVHAADDCRSSHGRGFARIAEQVGLEPAPKWTTTAPGPELIELIEQLSKELGPYPHRSLDPPVKEVKQRTRMLKVLCLTCGYTLRTAQQWLDQAGPPLCPGEECGQSPMEAQ